MALDLTQGDLARRIRYSPETVRKIEAGVLKPSKQIADLMADVLGVPSNQRDEYLAFAAGLSKASVAARLSNLPKPLTELLGREADLAALQKLLKRADTRLLTLIGPPGVGKTRVGVELTRRMAEGFADGACYIELAAMTSPEVVLAILAKALGVDERVDQPMLTLLQNHLRHQHVLLTLDNFEQVLDAAPAVLQLLAEAPKLKVIVTSREPLRVTDEQRYVVSPLPIGDVAVELFMQRAKKVQSEFAPMQDQVDIIAEICRKLDGLPLAIELAAARIALFSPKELLQRLDKRLSVLAGGSRDLPERQRTLRATLDWSYDLLTLEEQALYRRLSVFAGGCTLGAVQVFCEADHLAIDPVEGVAALVDKSLMTRGEFKTGETRFGMLETMREHALEKLAAAGESDVWHEQFTIFIADQLISKMTWLQYAPENWRTAIRWVQKTPNKSTLELRLLSHIALPPLEMRSWLETALERVDLGSTDTDDYLRVLNCCHAAYRMLGEHAKAKSLGEMLIQHQRKRNIPLELASALDIVGNSIRELGECEEARNLFNECNEILASLNLMNEVASNLITIAEIEVVEGNVTVARNILERAKALNAEHPLSPEWAQSNFLTWWNNHMAHVAMLEDDFAAAIQHLNVSLAEQNKCPFPLPSKWSNAWNQQSLAEIYLNQRDSYTAQQHIARSLVDLQVIGDKMVIAWNLAALAGALILDEEPERAAILWAASEALRERLGVRIAPASRKNRERTVALLHEQLGEARLQELLAEGRAMSMSQALEFARAGMSAE